MNPRNMNRQLQNAGLKTEKPVIETINGVDYQVVVVIDPTVGQPPEQRIIVNKAYYQSTVDRLTSALADVVALQDACTNTGEVTE